MRRCTLRNHVEIKMLSRPHKATASLAGGGHLSWVHLTERLGNIVQRISVLVEADSRKNLIVGDFVVSYHNNVLRIMA